MVTALLVLLIVAVALIVALWIFLIAVLGAMSAKFMRWDKWFEKGGDGDE